MLTQSELLVYFISLLDIENPKAFQYDSNSKPVQYCFNNDLTFYIKPDYSLRIYWYSDTNQKYAYDYQLSKLDTNTQEKIYKLFNI